MKHFVCVFFALALLTSATASPTPCNVTAEDEQTLLNTFFGMSFNCYTTLMDQRSERTTRDAPIHQSTNTRMRLLIRGICTEELPKYKVCVGKVETAASSCLNSTELLRHRLRTKYLSLEFELDCPNDGNRLTTKIESDLTYNPDGTIVPNPMGECQKHAEKSKPVNEGEDDDDVNQDILREFRKYRRVLKCLEGRRGAGDDPVVEAGLSLWTELTEKMICADAGGKEILCQVLVDNHYSTTPAVE